MSYLFRPELYPEQVGCYMMRDNDHSLLYIGKAKNLRSRLRSYFKRNHTDKRIRELVSLIASIEVILVNNEMESLLLENNLIKIHQPPYNHALKREDSGFSYLHITDEPFPRIAAYYRTSVIDQNSSIVKHHSKNNNVESPNNSKLFGPFSSSRYRDNLLQLVTEQFGLRSCEAMPAKACLLAHIDRCSGICEQWITKEQYMEQTEAARKLLTLPQEQMIDYLYQLMQQYADQWRYEKAQKLLLLIQNLQLAAGQTQIVERQTDRQQLVSYFGDDHVCTIRIRHGMMVSLHFEAVSRHCITYLKEDYLQQPYDELITNVELDFTKLKAEWKRFELPVPKYTLPKKGLKSAWLKLCELNYQYRIGQK